MMKSRKLLAVLLTLCMVLMLLPMSALAAGGNVAKIGETEYPILEAAVAAAQTGDTITLLSDTTLSSTLTIENGKMVTLDLNGCSISQTNLQTAAYSMIRNNGTLTIKDSVGNGKISYTDSGSGGEYVSDAILNAGTLTVESGTIENLSSQEVASAGYPHAIDNMEGTLTITGGTVSNSTYSAIRIWCDTSGPSDVIITGGNINGAVDLHNVGNGQNVGTLTITGGTFKNTANANVLRLVNFGTNLSGIEAEISGGTFTGGIGLAGTAKLDTYLKDVFSISGGTFSSDPSAYVASGYVVSKVSGKYVVILPPPPAGGGSSTTTVTVSVNSESGSANVSASVNGTAATVTVTDNDLNQIISSGSNTGNVNIDISGLNNVDSAVIPSNVITAVNGAADATGLTVALPGGSVGLDSDALAAVTAAAGGADVNMSVKTVDTSELSDSQQAVLGDQITNALVVDVSILAQETAISSFGGGTVTISVPYIPAAGVDTSKLVVWYLADDGSISPMEGVYDAATKSFVFETSHLSTYALVSFPFEDVTAGSWYYGNVAYAYNNSLFYGTSSETFSPDDTMTRAMLITVLWRLEKEPDSQNANLFADVAEGTWYTDAVVWAAENNIVDGYDVDSFGPSDPITREQMAAILYRYASYKGYDVTAAANLSAFNDAGNISVWALTAIKWAVAEDLITGVSETRLAPSENASRAQDATILMRFIENIMN